MLLESHLEVLSQLAVRFCVVVLVDGFDGDSVVLEVSDLLVGVLVVEETKLSESKWVLRVVILGKRAKSGECSVRSGDLVGPEITNRLGHVWSLSHCPELLLEVEKDVDE